MPIQDKLNRSTYVYIIGLSLFVFVIDCLTPLGYAGWALYVLPVVLCVLESRRDLPLAVAVGMLPLLLLGYVLSPPGASETVAAINRSVAVVSVFGVALMARRVIEERLVSQHLMWIERGRSEVSRNILGEPTVIELAERVLHALARYMEADVAVFYRLKGERLVRKAVVALDPQRCAAEIPLGAGIVGEVARSGKAAVLSDLPPDYLRIGSGTGDMLPAQVLIMPFSFDGKVAGVLEFGFRGTHTLKQEQELLERVSEIIGSAVRSAHYRENLRELLEETQRQSEELQTQQEELRVANEELTEQSKVLQESQAQLETQQSDLEQANVQLEERNQLLEQQKRNLVAAQRTVEENAAALERANRYKSEFLANMSHELRTPLNSALILSNVLAENKTGSLSEEQVRYARTIHSANTDLLTLINDILDLSKIEAGQVEVVPEQVSLDSLFAALRQTFEPVAAQKGLALRIAAAPGAPSALTTDTLRLQQILRNLLSNALKFTSEGEVRLEAMGVGGDRLKFLVIDTGIGIPSSQQEVIFEAFRQADGSTSRTHGGTGLGLSISRQLAQLLGGDVSVHSTPGEGSTFTLELPLVFDPARAQPGQGAQTAAPVPSVSVQPASATAAATAAAVQPAPRRAVSTAAAGTSPAPAAVPVWDDRDKRNRDRLILVIEDDEAFARILYDMAHEMNFDCVRAATGGEALRLAREFRPHGILLDIGLPDQSGLSVLEQIKRDPATRHLPVHVLSVDDYMQSAYQLGAVGYALKPVARDQLSEAISRLEKVIQARTREVLIVEDNVALGESLAALLKAEDIAITNVGTVSAALDKLSNHTYDCMVMDLSLPDGSGFGLLEQISQGGKYAFPPVIVYTGRVLNHDEEQKLRRYSRSIIVKGAKSPERLLDEVTLFLHRVESNLPPDQQKLLLQARQRDSAFEGRRILVAEDDVRNVFALTSILEPLGATLLVARNGKEALARLQAELAVDLVLMDLMMPEMDGLTAIRELRRNPAYARLPVIALTAKAMPDDRRECLAAGASDYIAKPIVVDQLLSLCRVWMPK